MRTLFLLALFSAAATAAPVPKEIRKQEKLAGLWKLESVTISGMASTVGANDTDWTFGENATLIRSSSQKEAAQNKIQLTIDTTTKELEWPSGGSPYLGRYEISGDRLTICLSMQNVPRPVKLEPNAQNYVWVLRRAEK